MYSLEDLQTYRPVFPNSCRIYDIIIAYSVQYMEAMYSFKLSYKFLRGNVGKEKGKGRMQRKEFTEQENE